MNIKSVICKSTAFPMGRALVGGGGREGRKLDTGRGGQ